MTRRDFQNKLVKCLGVSAVGVNVLANKELKTKTTKKQTPNIVIICSDQHAPKYSGYMHHPFVKTPNLDRIAQLGTVFTNTYCHNPVCAPSRTSMITGMYPSDCESYCNSTIYNGKYPTWAQLLKKKDYYCWATGKMDLTTKTDLGFEEMKTNHYHERNPDITALFRRPLGYRIKSREGVDGSIRTSVHKKDKSCLEVSLDHIRNRTTNVDQPWAAWIGFLQPHPEFKAAKKYFDMYYPLMVDMPNIPPDHLEDLPLAYQELRHFKRIATPIPDERIRRARAAYYGMITELDDMIGQIWKALEETGQLENTIFIYTSDHGESLGEHGLWYKNNLYDVAAKVPLIIAGPGIPKNKRIDHPVGHVDLIATMLDWAGVGQPTELRGKSLIPLINGDPGEGPEYVYSESHSEGNCTGSFVIRKGDWKYIHFTWYDDLLFNIKADPHELKNRIDDPDLADILSELKETLNQVVDPEKVTLQAFQKQKKILDDFVRNMSREELYDKLVGRLGKGQAGSYVSMLYNE